MLLRIVPIYAIYIYIGYSRSLAQFPSRERGRAQAQERAHPYTTFREIKVPLSHKISSIMPFIPYFRGPMRLATLAHARPKVVDIEFGIV
jgi:hypothetical protein